MYFLRCTSRSETPPLPFPVPPPHPYSPNKYCLCKTKSPSFWNLPISMSTWFTGCGTRQKVITSWLKCLLQTTNPELAGPPFKHVCYERLEVLTSCSQRISWHSLCIGWIPCAKQNCDREPQGIMLPERSGVRLLLSGLEDTWRAESLGFYLEFTLISWTFKASLRID